ncbi:SecDF P1 head subdomain-containing protein [Mesorhizobium sp. PL10]
MVHFARLKILLIWLAVATVLADASSLQAAGSGLLLQLDTADVVSRRLDVTRDKIRTLLRDARIGYSGLAIVGPAVQVHVTESGLIDPAKAALKTLTDPVVTNDSIQETTLDEPEPGLLKFTLTDSGIKYWTSAALGESTKVIERRVRGLSDSESSTAEGIVRQQGDGELLVQVPSGLDSTRLKGIVARTGMLSLQMVDMSMPVQDALNGRPPAGSLVLYSQDEPPVPYLVEHRIIVSNEDLLVAKAVLQNNQPIVIFRLDLKGTARFAQATSQNVGKSFAIVLDNQVISAATVREPILDGLVQISGNFTIQTANDLVTLLNAGPLPAKLTIVEESPMAAPR